MNLSAIQRVAQADGSPQHVDSSLSQLLAAQDVARDLLAAHRNVAAVAKEFLGLVGEAVQPAVETVGVVPIEDLGGAVGKENLLRQGVSEEGEKRGLEGW